MKVFAATVALSLMLTAAPTFAQQAPAPAAPRPAAPATPPPAAATKVPFPPGVKYAIVNLEEMFAASTEGQKVQAMINQKQSELGAKQKTLQDAQAKAQQNASVMSDAAKAQAQADIDRQSKDLERANEDAQTEVQNVLEQARMEWQRRVGPVVEKMAKERQLHFLLGADGTIVWADPAIVLTDELINAQGSAAAPAAAAPAPRPSTTTPGPKPAQPATGK
ncbi:MAG TPA: OmpH family outer membrane protein [Vicinamibacterales bacterium]|nr:OmpH family outer membrane protein [Vicinamibacterales bacterium]